MKYLHEDAKVDQLSCHGDDFISTINCNRHQNTPYCLDCASFDVTLSHKELNLQSKAVMRIEHVS